MKPSDKKTHNVIKKMFFKASPELDKDIWIETLRKHNEFHGKRIESGNQNVWRIIMKNKITKFATAAVIIIAVILVVNQFDLPTSVALGEVLQKIQSSNYKFDMDLIHKEEDGITMNCMIMQPDMIRMDVPAANMSIVSDMETGECIGLLHNDKTVLMVNANISEFLGLNTIRDNVDDDSDPFDILMFPIENLWNLQDGTEKSLDTKSIRDTVVSGFRIEQQYGNIKSDIDVWADKQTGMPIQIEFAIYNTKIKTDEIFNIVLYNFNLNTEPDKNLFSLEIPDGYVDNTEKFKERTVTRVQIGANVSTILSACIFYAEQNNHWPDNLEELIEYGIPETLLVNPRQPEKEIGFVYIKPQMPVSSQKVVLYEAYDSWSDYICVGFPDGHIDFILSEENFLKLLE